MANVPRSTVSSGPYSHIVPTMNRGTQFDIHGFLRDDILKQGGSKEVSYLQKGTSSTINSSVTTISGAGFSDTYIYFESFRNTTADRLNGSLTFSIPTINNNNSVSRVVAMRILPFYFPRLVASTTQPDVWFYKRMYIRVQPLATAGVRAVGTSTHQFECDVADKTGLNNLAVDITPIGTEGEGGIFQFRTPIDSISDITFQFLRPMYSLNGNSLTPIVLPQDVVAVNVIAANQLSITTLGVTTQQLFSLDPAVVYPFAPPAPGLPVSFAGFNGANSTLNNSLGYFVTNVVSPTVFDIAGLGATAPAAGTMLYMPNRIAFRVQFISVESTPTNFINLTGR